MSPPSIACLLLACIAAGLPAQRSALGRAVDRAADRMHERLTRGLDIWEDHSTFDKAWVVRSPHFEVHTTHSHGLGRDIGNGLEQMLAIFQNVLGTEYEPAERMRVFILPSRQEYNTFGNDHGEDHSSFYGSFFAVNHPQRPVAVEYNPNPTLLRMHITHSVVHQYLHQAYPASVGRRPAWVEEGLAAYFTAYWNFEWTRERYREEKDEARLVRMQRILADGLAAFGNDTETRMLQLAVFFDYLLNHREDTRSLPGEDGLQPGPFRDYLVAILEARPVADAAILDFLTRTQKLIEDFENFEFPR